MPAPKQFKPGPQTTREQPQTSGPVVTKGRYAVVTPMAPIVDNPAVVEVTIDDITLVMGGSSKYEQRSLHAYGEIEEPAVDEVPVVSPGPVSPERTPLGAWQSESSLDGTH
ncbi:MAG TPA: hypothetical protein VFD97_03890, partial [Acidimicrobiia bacterium]|nr:hypothetical protein [Acidimicrobiia bacterium]